MEPYSSAMKTTVDKCGVFISFDFYQFFCQCSVQHYYEIKHNDVSKAES